MAAPDNDTITLSFGNASFTGGTFSGDISVSDTQGDYSDITAGANGQFRGNFYDDLNTYDASTAAPDEVAGTLDGVMGTSGELVGGFVGQVQ